MESQRFVVRACSITRSKPFARRINSRKCFIAPLFAALPRDWRNRVAEMKRSALYESIIRTWNLFRVATRSLEGKISPISIKSDKISFDPVEYLLIWITPSLAISANKRIEFDRLQTSLYAFYLSLRRMLGSNNVTRRYQTLRVWTHTWISETERVRRLYDVCWACCSKSSRGQEYFARHGLNWIN